jgi:hypothetical protein
MRKAMILLAVLALPGCAVELGARARNICQTNGHQMGTPAFDRCFEQTLRSLSISVSGV